MPCKLAVCGLPLVLSTTVNVPEIWPTVVGVYVTLIAQLPPAGIEAGHVLAAKGPVVVTLVTPKAVD